MKILIVCSGNSGKISPFILDQVAALRKYYKLDFDFFLIKGYGILGYLKSYPLLKKIINNFRPDLIHAHFSLSGLLANLQRKVPVITTFHGSDVNNNKNIPYSKIANCLSKSSIFVSENMKTKLNGKQKAFVIPCGVDLNIFAINNDSNFISDNNYHILFSSSFGNQVKNYSLAKESLTLVEKEIDRKVDFIELKGYNRQGVAELMHNVDCLLLTSFSEGSPQIVKEAMACNLPIVATNVGDVRWLFGNEPGYYLTSFEPEDVAEKIKLALDFKEKHGSINGRKRIINLGLDSESIARKIINIYKDINNGA